MWQIKGRTKAANLRFERTLPFSKSPKSELKCSWSFVCFIRSVVHYIINRDIGFNNYKALISFFHYSFCSFRDNCVNLYN